MLHFEKSRALRLVVLLLTAAFFSSCATKPKAPEAPVTPVAATSVSPSQYVLGPDDQISVSVWRQDTLKTVGCIDPDGNINMELIGQVKASGLTPNQLSKEIETRMADYLKEPKVSVSITSIASRKIYVLGEVKVPGSYSMTSDMNAWEAIAKAGGFSSDANKKNLLLVREQMEKGRKVARVDVITLNSITGTNGVSQSLSRIQNRDIIYVAPTRLANAGTFMTRMDTILRPFLDTASVIVLGNQVYEIYNPKTTSSSPGISIAP